MEGARGVIGTEGRAKKRTGTSKYDFFKVKVWLGENMDHYYVLSRFLICRMLTVTKIPYIKAVKIALETKKYLVDNDLQDVTQAELEKVLFSIIRSKGFDEQYIDCYRMVTHFYQQRQPLCIIVCGAAWTGKSTIAQQLASRINIPNVMQTDVIYELLRAGGDSPLNPEPIWCRPGLSDTALVAEFRREACVVRKGMDGDLIKTLSDGKPIIIEGMHLDPELYIQDFGRRGIIMLPAKPAAGLSPARTAARSTAAADGPAGSPAKAGYSRSMVIPSRREVLLTAEGPTAAAVEAACGAVVADCTSGARQQQGLTWGRSMSAGADISSARRSAASGVHRLAPAPGVPDVEDSAAAAVAEQLQVKQQAGGHGQQQQQQLLQRHAQHHQGQSQQSSEEFTIGITSNNSIDTSAHANNPQVLALASSGEVSKNSSQVQQHLAIRHQGSASSSSHSTALLVPGMYDTRQLNLNSSQQTDAASLGLAVAYQGRSSDDSSRQAAAAVNGDAVHSANGNQTSGVTDGEQIAQPKSESSAQQQVVGAAAVERPSSQVQSGHAPSPPAVYMLGELQVCAATAEAAALQQHWQQYQQQPHNWSHRQQQQLGLAPPDSPYSSADSEGGHGLSPSVSQEHSTTEVVSRQQSCCSPLLSQEPSVSELGLIGALSKQQSDGHAGAQFAGSRQQLQQQSEQLDLAPPVEQQQQDAATEGTQQRRHLGKVLHSWQEHQQYSQGHCHASSGPAKTHGVCSCVTDDVAAGSTAVAPAKAVSNGVRNSTAAGLAHVATELQQLLQHQHPDAVEVVGQACATNQHVCDAKHKQEPDQQQQQQQYYSSLPLHLPTSAGKLPDSHQGEGTCCTNNSTGAAITVPAAAATTSELGPSTTAAAAATAPRETAPSSAAESSSSLQGGGPVQQQPPPQQQQVGSTGTQQEKKEPVQRPLFVPILVYMEEADHVLMQEEALSHSGLLGSQPSSEAATAAADGGNSGSNKTAEISDAGSSGVSGSGAAVQVSASEALRRMRLLQEYLCAYEAQGLPVVKVSYGNFGEALDKLHEYILQCIKCVELTPL